MRIRHIIIEGCDGSGKSTLLGEIASWKRPPDTRAEAPAAAPWFAVHERASTSLGGPVDDLVSWVEKDIQTMATQAPSVYDRHPIVSEPIYGPICRGSVPGKFNDGVWVSTTRSIVAHYCAVIWCVPPWDRVRDNLAATPHGHMPGVIINARRIYDAYDKASRAWPGVSLRYDYTRPGNATSAYLNLLVRKS